MTDNQIIERLAEFTLGNEQKYSPSDKDPIEKGDWTRVIASGHDWILLWNGNQDVIWNPLTDWNHWRQVEEKVMEDEKLYRRFANSFVYYFDSAKSVEEYMAHPLPTRCKALLSALDSLNPSPSES